MVTATTKHTLFIGLALIFSLTSCGKEKSETDPADVQSTDYGSQDPEVIFGTADTGGAETLTSAIKDTITQAVGNDPQLLQELHAFLKTPEDLPSMGAALPKLYQTMMRLAQKQAIDNAKAMTLVQKLFEFVSKELGKLNANSPKDTVKAACKRMKRWTAGASNKIAKQYKKSN